MNAIKRTKIRLIAEIIIIIIFVVLSYTWWDKLDISKFSTYAANSSQMLEFSKENYKPISNALVPMDNETAKNSLDSGIIEIKNSLNIEKEYELGLIIDKVSTVNYQQLIISVDNEIFELKNIKMLEDDSQYYFPLKKYFVVNSNTHEIKMWIDKDVEYLKVGGTLSFTFDIKEAIPN